MSNKDDVVGIAIEFAPTRSLQDVAIQNITSIKLVPAQGTNGVNGNMSLILTVAPIDEAIVFVIIPMYNLATVAAFAGLSFL